MGKCSEASINFVGTVDDDDRAAATAECEAQATAATDAFSKKTPDMICLREAYKAYNIAAASWNNAEVLPDQSSHNRGQC